MTQAEPRDPDHGEPGRTDFTHELTELCRRHGVGIEGGRIWEMDRAWTGPDSDLRAEYAVAEDGSLVRTFSQEAGR